MTERKDVEESGSDEDMAIAEKSKSPSPARSRRSSAGSSKGSRSSSASDIGAGKKKKSDKARQRASSASSSEDKSEEKEGEEGASKEPDVAEADVFGSDLSISSEEEEEAEAAKDEEMSQKKAKLAKLAKLARKRVMDDDEDDVERYEDDDEKEKEDEEKGDKDEGGGDKAADEDNVKRYGEDRVEDEPIPETRIDVEVPKISTNLGEEVHFVKLPNFLSVDCRPFDPEHYEDEIEDEDSLDEEGRARLKLKVENTIRWKIGFDEKGNTKRESNARIVKWSDGSMSLHLGSEIFDVYRQPLQGDFNHLFIRQGTGLQGQAVFRTKLSFRPHSTDSFTHQKLTRNMADRSNKAAGIKVISQVGRDPEANRYKRVKEEEERLRASMRRESKVKRIKERSTKHGLSSGYLEGGEDDSDEEEGLNALKNRYKQKKGGDRPIYSSAEDDSDVETSKAKRLEKSKKLDSDSDGGEAKAKRRSRSRSGSASGSARSGAAGSRSGSGSRSRSGSRSGSARSRSGSPRSGGKGSRSPSPAGSARSRSSRSSKGGGSRSGSGSRKGSGSGSASD